MKKFFSSKPAQPLIYALCIVIGLLGGKKLYQSQSYQLGFSNAETGKGKLYDILKKVNEYYVDSVDTRNLEEKTIVSLLKNLDPHSYYLSKENMSSEDDRLNGNFSGIGVEFKIIDDTIVIMRAIEGGPSFKIGIQTGDKIIAVNGGGFTGDSVTSQLAMKHLKGEKGTEVKVNFLRDNKIVQTTITRGEIPLNSVDVFTVIKNEIGYIKISRFSKRTNREFEEAVAVLLKQDVKSFIIDVRDNPGGLMSSVVEVCESLLDKNKLIVYTKGRLENEEEKSRLKGKLADYPIYVLINENSASASEILAGAIQDNDRGTIIGRRSFGKGLVQRPFMLADGSALRLTIARYYTPSGRCIQRSYEHGNDEYNQESYNRGINGELSTADSIPVADSLKFYTTKGKLVYGGGGIVPDIFIPTDTSSFSDLAIQILNKQLVEHFLLQNLKYWKELLQDKDLSQSYFILKEKDMMWNKFTSYVQAHEFFFGTERRNINLLKNRVEPILINKILQLKFNELGQHYSHFQSDPEILKAVELHFSNKLNP